MLSRDCRCTGRVDGRVQPVKHVDPDNGELSQAQYDDRIRAQIQHEDELVNVRVVSQLLAQSFFFSTYAFPSYREGRVVPLPPSWLVFNRSRS